MPYQDIEDINVVAPKRPPTFLGRWLRRLFVDDWGVKLLALGITLALWMAVADFNKPRTIRVAVQLNFVRPPNLDISNEPPRTIDVELTGSRERLDNMRLSDLVATVDISDHPAGERILRLNNERVHMELPDGVKIESFKPTTIPIRLEPNLERQLPVDIKLEGQPAAGFELISSTAQPNVISVSGPASLIEKLQQAPTELISIEGKKGNFTALGVTIAIPDPRIEVENPVVDVAIEIGEKKSPANTPVSSSSR
ncbi:MAG TPA: CdaR family protein, partial [Pyrinomonadaceae bacterium]|nr:CdaR family protein [Pyrinomonadaceae bacterium]